MAIPGILGHLLDRWLGTWFLFLAIGGMLGFFVGLFSLIRLAESVRRQTDSSTPRTNRKP
jgi:F0F1-type ATP synthase assembly protein I